VGEAIKEHKAEIIRILREDEEMRCTSIIQSERMLFKLARDFFGVNEKGGTAAWQNAETTSARSPSGRKSAAQRSGNAGPMRSRRRGAATTRASHKKRD